MPPLLASGFVGMWRYLVTMNASTVGRSVFDTALFVRTVNASLPAADRPAAAAWDTLLQTWAASTGQTFERAAAALAVDNVDRAPAAPSASPKPARGESAPFSSGGVAGVVVASLVVLVGLFAVVIVVQRRRGAAASAPGKPLDGSMHASLAGALLTGATASHVPPGPRGHPSPV